MPYIHNASEGRIKPYKGLYGLLMQTPARPQCIAQGAIQQAWQTGGLGPGAAPARTPEILFTVGSSLASAPGNLLPDRLPKLAGRLRLPCGRLLGRGLPRDLQGRRIGGAPTGRRNHAPTGRIGGPTGRRNRRVQVRVRVQVQVWARVRRPTVGATCVKGFCFCCGRSPATLRPPLCA